MDRPVRYEIVRDISGRAIACENDCGGVITRPVHLLIESITYEDGSESDVDLVLRICPDCFDTFRAMPGYQED